MLSLKKIVNLTKKQRKNVSRPEFRLNYNLAGADDEIVKV